MTEGRLRGRWCLAVLFTCVLSAQDVALHHSWGCSSIEADSTFSAELNRPSKIKLVPTSNAAALRRAATGGLHIVFNKIDAAKYGLHRVDFYMHLPMRAKTKNENEYVVNNQPFQVYVKLTHSAGPTWWRLTESPGEEHRFLEVLETPRNGKGNAPGNDPIQVVPATGNRTIPIFDLTWSADVSTTMWPVGREAHLMLDLRSLPPKVVADLACDATTAFGACGVYRAQHMSRSNDECDWSAARSDFVCEEDVWDEVRHSKSWFELISGGPVPFAVPPQGPKTLEQFAQMAERDAAWRNRQVDVPGLGKTSHLLRLVTRNQTAVHIFGTYGTGTAFDARFFYVFLSKGSAPLLGYIPDKSIFDDFGEDENASTEEKQKATEGKTERPALSANRITTGEAVRPELPTNHILTGEALSFQINSLFATSKTHIYQVTAKEGSAAENAGHAVYWLAIDEEQADGTIRFEMPKLASDQLIYTDCSSYRTEASAAVITIDGGRRFSAQIDVEPSHLTREDADGFDAEDPNSEDSCPYRVSLQWDHAGWISSERKRSCPKSFSPRRIRITADGSITPMPAKTNDPDAK
jgi:hypothetical protein